MFLIKEEGEAQTEQLLSSGKNWKSQVQVSANIKAYLYKVEAEKNKEYSYCLFLSEYLGDQGLITDGKDRRSKFSPKWQKTET